MSNNRQFVYAIIKAGAPTAWNTLKANRTKRAQAKRVSQASSVVKQASKNIKSVKKKQEESSNVASEASVDGVTDTTGSTANAVPAHELSENVVTSEHKDNVKYKHASRKRSSVTKNYYNALNEHVAIETFPDGLIHRYMKDIQIDCDKNDIVTTCSFHFPYDNDLMEYWEPANMSCKVYGGSFDVEPLFMGRVREVRQTGHQIEVTCENIGWKLKQTVPEDVLAKIKGQTIDNALDILLADADIPYHVNLDGIPGITSYTVDDEGCVSASGELVESIPELTEVIEKLGESDIYNDLAIDKSTMTTQQNADKFASSQMTKLDWVVNASNSYVGQDIRNSLTFPYGIDIANTTSITKQDQLKVLADSLIGDMEYPKGDQTYDDIIHSIASAIDAHYYIVLNKLFFISFPVLFMMDSDQTGFTGDPFTLDYWMQADGTYELDVNQYGFYNTVQVNYDGGTVTACNDDLVRIYGEMKIEYDEDELDKAAAQLKAQAYLSAHIRDFNMSVRVSVLHTGKIIVGSFIKIKNPLTMSENLMYVYGMSISWSAGEDTFKCNLELKYGPENPDDPEVPTASTQTASTGNCDTSVPQVVADFAHEATSSTDPTQIVLDCCGHFADVMDYYHPAYADFPHPTLEIFADTSSSHYHKANCGDGSRAVAEMCASLGVIINYEHMPGHYYNSYNGQPYDWCYMNYGHPHSIGHNHPDKVSYKTTVYPTLPIQGFTVTNEQYLASHPELQSAMGSVTSSSAVTTATTGTNTVSAGTNVGTN